jgi:kynurenine formamidase
MTLLEVTSLLATLRNATLYDLEQPRYGGAPTFAAHRPGFVYGLHRRHEPGLGEARTSASGLMVMAEHSGTHIDALCHQAEDLQLFGGIRADAEVQTSAGFTRLGVETIGPVIARGVLIDVARHRGVDRLPYGDLVDAEELQAAATAQTVSVRAGDVVLVRTGTGSQWRDPEEYLRGAAIAADASEWLAGRKVMAVGADNCAWDAPAVAEPDRGKPARPPHPHRSPRDLHHREPPAGGARGGRAPGVPLHLSATEAGRGDRLADLPTGRRPGVTVSPAKERKMLFLSAEHG